MTYINKLYEIILKYIGKNTTHKNICDIVMLFTVLGNDFFPKIMEIN